MISKKVSKWRGLISIIIAGFPTDLSPTHAGLILLHVAGIDMLVLRHKYYGLLPGYNRML